MVKKILLPILATLAQLYPWSSAVAQVSADQTIRVVIPGVLTISLTEPLVTGDPNSNEILAGDFVVRSNQRNGYEVRVSSGNGSELVGSDGTFSLPYTLSVGAQQTFAGPQGSGTSGSNLTLPVTLPGVLVHTSVNFSSQNCAPITGCRNGITLNLSQVPAEALPPDTYTDVITYTLTAQ